MEDLQERVRLIDNEILSLLFEDCYHADFQMNFGIIAVETISDFLIDNTDSKVSEITSKWGKIGFFIDIKCYKLITNSTNSIIKIYCKELLITNPLRTSVKK